MTTNVPVCPMCESGQLTEATYTDTFTYNGRNITVEGLKCYECSNCGADPVFTPQILHNQQLIADAKRNASGLLTGADIKKIREHLNLTQQGIAALLGGGTNAFSKYERGEVIQSEPMDKLLKIAEKYSYILEDKSIFVEHDLHFTWTNTWYTRSTVNKRVMPGPVYNDSRNEWTKLPSSMDWQPIEQKAI